MSKVRARTMRVVQSGSKLQSPHILDAAFKYTPAAQTDITKTWRRFGWKPLAERGRK